MLELAWPKMLILLPLPWLVTQVLARAKPLPGARLKVPFYHRLQQQQRQRGGRSARHWRKGVSWLIWILLVIACAGPRALGPPLENQRAGRDLMLAVDISRSMLREDITWQQRKASRINVVKAVAGDFITRREGDRVGLILFGTQAFLQTPLTFDRHTNRQMLFEGEVGLAGDNTAVGDAIALAVKHLIQRPAESRAIILITDGANNAGTLTPAQATQLAQHYQIRVYTIGVGSRQPRILDLFGGGFAHPTNQLDEEALRRIAERTDGRYFRAVDAAGLEKIYRALDRLEPIEAKSPAEQLQQPLFMWPLGLALLLSAMIALSFVQRRSHELG